MVAVVLSTTAVSVVLIAAVGGWVLLPVFERVSAFQQSVARYPNIKPGQDFSGYT
jgi:hypothetical protein